MKYLIVFLLLFSTQASAFKPEFEHLEFYTVIKIHETKADMFEHYKKVLKNSKSKVKRPKADFRAFATWTKKPLNGVQYCVLNIVKPPKGKRSYRPIEQEFGHELMHCIYGSYHQ